MKKSIKIIVIILSSLLLLLIVALFSIPRAIPSYVEKNSQELIGRKIETGKVRLNYATLTLNITDFVLYELNKRDTFVSFDEYNVNLDLIPTLRGNYTISSMLLDNLNVNVTTDGEYFNFEDMIMEGDTTVIVEEEIVDAEAEPVRFTLQNIELRKGDISYHDTKADIQHDLSNIGFVLPQFSWDNEASSEMGLTFKFEPQGILELKADVDYTHKRYSLTAKVIDLALAPFSAYLESMLASQGIEGTLNNTIYVEGSIENTNDIVISGFVELSDFLLKDEKGAPVFENGLLGVYLDSIDMQNNYFGIRKVLISEPQVYASLYETYTNFDELMKPMTEAAAAGDTLPEGEVNIETTADDSVFFQVDTFLVDGGAVYLTDHTLNRPFNYKVLSIHTLVTDINPEAHRVPIAYSLKMNKSAMLVGDAEISMVDASYLKYSGELKGLNLTSFSPYSEFYIARPIKSGHFKFKGNAKMTETQFNAENVISINDISLGEKMNDDPQVNIPVNLALGILKDKNGDVRIDVPMEGNPSDPDFSVGKIIGKTLTDFVLKIASTPFAIVGDIAGVDPERLKEVPLHLASSELADEEKETLNQIALALKEKPELEFHFTLESPDSIEKTALAVRQVKANYLKSIKTKSEEMDEALSILSNNDDALTAYVTEKLGAVPSVSFGEQCVSIVGDESLDKDLLLLADARNKNMQVYLFETLQVDPESIDIRTMDHDNHTADIKEPRYRVEVSVK